MFAQHSKSVYKKTVFVIFVLLEIILYAGFLYMDITGKGSFAVSNYLKFTGIILCFLFTVLFPGPKEDRTDTSILRAALLFTLISDWFILILDYYVIGIITFCIVQFLYLIRLGIWRNQMDPAGGAKIILKNFIRNLFFALFIIIILNAVKIRMEWLVLVTCFYFTGILFNVWDSIIIACKSKVKNRIRYAFGMVLFLLCDINVGLFNLSGFLASSWFDLIYSFSTVAMWLFYLPAQVIISLSVGNIQNESL